MVVVVEVVAAWGEGGRLQGGTCFGENRQTDREKACRPENVEEEDGCGVDR